jgi:transmembrane sensor
MNGNFERIRELLLRYSGNNTQKDEEVELFTLLSNATETEIEPLLTDILESTEPDFDEQRREKILAKVFDTVNSEEEEANGQWSTLRLPLRANGQNVKVRRLWQRIAVAASLVGVLFVGYWLIKDKTTDDGHPSTALRINDVQAPDKNRAQITLADGTTVYLDSSGNGQLAMVNGIKVTKTDDGKIVYQTTDDGQQTTVEYNTLSNPRGSKVIDMTLSDGSRVWLNAGSSITYPVAFIGNERKVTIAGEGYFEVSRQTTANGQRKKFFVESGTMQVEVLGTHFNVNAYDDDNEISVTLLEGSVKVQSSVDSRQSSILKPGEQAVINSKDEIRSTNDVDVDVVMAWKNGLFKFDGNDVDAVMKQISRWYDVEVVYEGAKPVANFRGTISRRDNISEVLKMLELTKAVNFKVEGKKVIVRK